MKLLSVYIILFLLFFNPVNAQKNRIALVIGNENYENNLPLYNPINDANAMEKALIDAGFIVLKYTDLDKKSLKTAIDNFGVKLINYDIGLFFYAGHGIQYNGLNYLIPIDAHLKSESDVTYECVEAQRILELMEKANNTTNIVILDACRNNPFAKSWTRNTATQGLAFMNAPSGSIIAFATSPGKTAFDGSGNNGLYTSALLKYIQFPNIKIEDVFKRVRSLVREKSKGEQIPWENTSLEGDFYFHIGDNFIDEKSYSIDNKNNELNNENEFIDTRDGKKYKCIKLGKQVWMAENLNFETENSWCYGNSSRNCSIYGRLYIWESAMDACPEGWKLPNDQDWKDLEVYIGMNKHIANEKFYRGENEANLLRAQGDEYWIKTNDNINDKFDFSALPAGVRDADGVFIDLGKETFFWSSTKYTEITAWTRSIQISNKQIFRFANPKILGYSIRCIKIENN